MLEAIFAILIVLSVVVFVTLKDRDIDLSSPSLVESSQRFVLDTVSFDTALRYCIVEGLDDSGSDYVGICNPTGNFIIDTGDLPASASTARIDDFTSGTEVACGQAIGNLINESLPSGYYYTCEICDSALSCLPTAVNEIPTDGRDVFTRTVFLAVSEENIKEKVLRLYYWKCSTKDNYCNF